MTTREEIQANLEKEFSQVFYFIIEKKSLEDEIVEIL